MAQIDMDGADSERNISEATGPGNPSLHAEYKIARYVEEIELYDKEVQRWDRQSKRIIRRYKDDRGGDGTIESQERRFNILWSNTQNLLPTLYARNPKPDIQRRYKDADPIGRVTSDVLERSATYFCDTDHFASTSRQCVLDYLLPGRGTVWVRYVPYFKPSEEITDDIGPGDADAPQAQAPEVIDYEEVIPDYVHRKDFGHNICRTWDEVWLGWRKVYLTRKELSARFKEPLKKLYRLSDSGADLRINQIPLDYKKTDNSGRVIDDGVGKAIIYEAWDKIRKEAIWFHKSIPHSLDQRPDPLRLDNFFPFPKPLFTNLVNDSLIPTPLYVEYQDQAAELDLLTARIAMMTRCLKVVGIYDASAEGLNRMFNEGTENELIPVQQWALMQEKGGMQNAFSLLDVSMIAKTLIAAYEARDKVMSDLDMITGMSDIVRGATDPSETASAQKLKAGFAGQRISDMQRDVQRFIRETIRIMTDVICNHFQIETIKQISGIRLLTQAEKQAYLQAKQMAQQGTGAVQPPQLPQNVTPDQMEDMLNNPTWEEVEALIRNNALRCFRIDIETDSTVKVDEQQDKSDRVEFLKAAGGFLQQAVEAGAQQPALVPLLGQMLMFGIRAFPVGKELESTFASTIQKLEKEAANPQPKPNPEMMKIQGEQQLGQQRLQSDMQIAQAKVQGDIEVETAKAHLAAQTAAAEQQAQGAQAAQENQLEDARERNKLEREMQMKQIELDANTQLELTKARIQQETAIEVARINAAATDGAREEAEAEARDDKLEGPIRDEELHAKLDALLQHLAKPQPDVASAINNLASAHKQTSDSLANLHKAVTSEKEIVRDPKSGKPMGVRIKQDPKELANQLRN